MDMTRFYEALVKALQEAHRQGWKDCAEVAAGC
jgi:hypothetical protein